MTITKSGQYKYWAFISYSHVDEKWANWLHRSLERYHVPMSLLQQISTTEKIPRRLFPIFKDKNELSSSSDLPTQIELALKESRHLIVICSPHSAISRWVNEEVLRFKQYRGEKNIFCLVVDGEPNATDDPGRGLLEAFPKPVRFKLAEDNNLSSIKAQPLAADVRKGKGSRNTARLKLISGMLGVGFDALYKRDKKRRQYRLVQLALVSVLMVTLAVFGAIKYYNDLGVQTHIAQAKNIASRAAMAMVLEDTDTDIDKAILIAAESLRYLHTLEADRILRKALSVYPHEIFRVNHDDQVNDVALSPNGKYLVTASSDNSARVISIDTGKEVFSEVFPGEKGTAIGDVSISKFSPSGKYLAITSYDENFKGIGKLLNVDGFAKHFSFQHNAMIYDLAFSPDEKYLATASGDNTAQILDMKTGQVVESILHDNWVFRVVFSPDNRYLATASSDQTIIVYDLIKKDVRYIFKHEGTIDELDFSPHSKLLASGSRDKTTRIYDLGKGKEIKRLTHDRMVKAINFSRSSKYLATASDDGKVLVLNTQNWNEIVQFDMKDQISSMAISPDEQYVVVGAYKVARLFDIEKNIELLRMPHEGHVRSLSFSKSGALLATGSWDHTARLFSIKNTDNQLSKSLGAFSILDLSSDGKLVAARVSGGTNRQNRHIAELADRHSGEQRLKIPGELSSPAILARESLKKIAKLSPEQYLQFTRMTGFTVEALKKMADQNNTVFLAKFSEDSKLIAIGDVGGVVRVFDIAMGKSIFRYDIHDDKASLQKYSASIQALSFSSDGTRLVIGYRLSSVFGKPVNEGLAKVFNLKTKDALSSFAYDGAVYSAAFDSQGEYLAIGNTNNEVQVYDTNIWQSLLKTYVDLEEEQAAFSVAISPNRQYLAVAGLKNIGIHDIKSDKRVIQFTVKEQISKTLFSPDSKYLLASGSFSGVAHLYDVNGMTEISRMKYRNMIEKISFSGDSENYIITAGLVEHSQPIGKDKLISAACKKVNRNLTHEEWQYYLPDIPYREICNFK